MLRRVAWIWLVGVASAVAQPLTYQNGGDPNNLADPGQDTASSHRRYVCSNGGNDNASGLSASAAWASVDKVRSAHASIPKGAIISFCRGGMWPNISDLGGIRWGDPGNPTAFGAYGAGNPPRFNNDVRFDGSSYFTVRDWDVHRLFTSMGAHDFLVLNNICRGSASQGYPSNCFASHGASYHGVLIGNLAYDIGSNDLFTLHTATDGNDTANRDGWWLIDNMGIGNTGIEDCYDFAQSNALDGTGGDSHISADVKVVSNKCGAMAVSGVSAAFPGMAVRCFQNGHSGRYMWFVGNICSWSHSSGFKTGTHKAGVRYSGNISFGAGFSNGNISIEFVGEGNADATFDHNTVLHAHETRNPITFDANPMTSVQHNIFYTTISGNTQELVETVTPNSAIRAMDYNWYGNGLGRVVTDGQTLQQRKASSSFDRNSGEGNIPGIDVPPRGAWSDPRQWNDPAFLNFFVPSPSWAGCNGDNTPGAFDCNGKRLGLVLDPIPGAPNGGCGWAGLPIVVARLAELGVTGVCMSRYTNMAARPAAPRLQAVPK